MGKLVSLPRRLEWVELAAWEGKVAGTQLLARVVERPYPEPMIGMQYHWTTMNGSVPIGWGAEDNLKLAQEKAKKSLETLKVLHFADGSTKIEG